MSNANWLLFSLCFILPPLTPFEVFAQDTKDNSREISGKDQNNNPKSEYKFRVTRVKRGEKYELIFELIEPKQTDQKTTTVSPDGSKYTVDGKAVEDPKDFPKPAIGKINMLRFNAPGSKFVDIECHGAEDKKEGYCLVRSPGPPPWTARISLKDGLDLQKFAGTPPK